jgi:hypothetical protein
VVAVIHIAPVNIDRVRVCSGKSSGIIAQLSEKSIEIFCIQIKSDISQTPFNLSLVNNRILLNSGLPDKVEIIIGVGFRIRTIGLKYQVVSMLTT